MATPNYSYVRPEVVAMLPRWTAAKDAFEGEYAMKARDSLTPGTYLPTFKDVEDETAKDRARYAAYIKRAVYYPIAGRTLRALVGQVFQKAATIELPELLQALIKNVDGAGVSLAQQAQASLAGVLGYGRGGLLADYPRVTGGASLADQQAGRVRPKIVTYDPWQIINWRVLQIGALQVPVLVVLREQIDDTSDLFSYAKVDRWRVLSIDPKTQTYRVDVVTTSATNKGEFVQMEDPVYPVDGNNQPFREIPFQFLGAVENNVDVDVSPMEDIVTLNRAHYGNSADYEESVFMHGQATPWASGLTEDWVKKQLKGKLRLGSRGLIPLPAGEACGLLQAQPNSMVREAMQDKERAMVALGARLIEQRQVERTATEAKQERASEISILSMCANNVTAGYQRVLGWCQQFARAAGKVQFEIDPAYYLGQLSPAEQQQLIAHYQAGGLSFTEYRSKLRSAGLATQTDEEAKKEIDEESKAKAALAPKPAAPAEQPITPMLKPGEMPGKPGAMPMGEGG